jgi:glycosyltransferase involved in cell wall biosynthesis
MNVLYTTCFLDVSGVTKINLDILTAISGKFNIHVCETASDEKLSSKLESYFRAMFGETLQLWRISSNERYSFFVNYLRENAIDLIYNTHSLWVYEHVARLKRDHPRLKIVDSLHVLEPYCFRGGYPDISANRFVHPYIDKSIVISDHLLSYITRHYSVNSEKFVVIRNGVDMEQFRNEPTFKGVFKDEIGVPTNATLIGFIGRFSVQKRPAVFLEVAKRLTERLEHVYFYMAGGGELVKESQRIAKKLGIAERVKLVPPRDDIHIVLNSTDMLLVTSSYEGAPLTILEALATGVPVMSYDVGAIGEYIGKECLVALGTHESARMAETALKHLQMNIIPGFDRSLYGIERLVSQYIEVFETC